MPRVAFYTLGCKLNFAETSSLQRAFEEEAYEVVPFGEAAQVAVINTCTVTAEADRKCRQVIRRALRANPDTCVVVTGCYAQLQPEVIAGIDGVDVVLGAQEKFQLFHLINAFEKQDQTQVHVSCIDEVSTFGPAYSSNERTRAFLKVQDGCDYTCSFCTIPMARGKSRSAPLEQVIAQAHEIAARGYQEIVLSGVNIGLYGQGTHDQGGEALLLDLLRALDAVDGIERYRISSIEPNLLTDAIIDFVGASSSFQPHFHIPLQSGDDHILGKMRRRYRRTLYADRLARIIRLMPDACIGADVIVGFPAETDAHFDNTYQFLSDLPIAYLHAFTYSERPNTVAVDQIERMGHPPVPKAERSRRNKRLRILSQKKQHAFYSEHLGSERPVLWESADKGGTMYGFTDNYIKVQRPFDATRVGTIETVHLSDFAADGTVSVDDSAFISIL